MRGMDYYHDVHDWLGGYPCETILSTELAHAFGGASVLGWYANSPVR